MSSASQEGQLKVPCADRISAGVMRFLELEQIGAGAKRMRYSRKAAKLLMFGLAWTTVSLVVASGSPK
eukprot:11463367-Heterocapsa_arctica.AAC.1